jgi:hypothetical protein
LSKSEVGIQGIAYAEKHLAPVKLIQKRCVADWSGQGFAVPLKGSAV